MHGRSDHECLCVFTQSRNRNKEHGTLDWDIMGLIVPQDFFYLSERMTHLRCYGKLVTLK